MPYSTPRAQRYALAAAAIFAFAAGYDLWHVVAGEPFAGTLALGLTIAAALVSSAVWMAAAALLIVRDRRRTSDRLARAAFGTSVVGAFLVLAHGLGLRGPLGDPMGIAFIVGGIALGILVKLAWTPFPWSRGERPAQAPPHRMVRGPEGEEHPVL